MGSNYKMNILQIADYAAPYRGNFIACLETLREELEKNDCKMIYLFPEKAKKYRWVQELINLKVTDIYFYTNNVLKNFFLIIRIVKKHHINIFHVHFRNIKIALPVTLAHFLFKNTFYFTHLHGEYRKSSLFREYLRRIARWNTFYIACSKPVFNQIIQAGINRSRVFCIENAVDFSRLDKYEILTNDRFGLDNDTKKILIFGYNWYIKGVDIALEAVKDLVEENKKIVLLISVAANRGALENYIINKFGQIPKWVILLEPRDDIATYYKFSDIFISPSRTEGFSYAVVEAAYCEIPVIVSDIPAQKNLKLLGDVYFETENVEQLKLQIDKRLKYQDIELLKRQKEIVIKNYSLDRWVREILNAYNRVMNFYSVKKRN